MPRKRHNTILFDENETLKPDLTLLSDNKLRTCVENESYERNCSTMMIIEPTKTPSPKVQQHDSLILATTPIKHSRVLYLEKSNYSSNLYNLELLFESSYFNDSNTSIVATTDSLPKQSDNVNVRTQTDKPSYPLLIDCQTNTSNDHVQSSPPAMNLPRLSPTEVSFFTPQLYRTTSSTPVLIDDKIDSNERACNNRPVITPIKVRTLRRRNYRNNSPKLSCTKKRCKLFQTKTLQNKPLFEASPQKWTLIIAELLKRMWHEFKRCATATVKLIKISAKVGKSALFYVCSVVVKKDDVSQSQLEIDNLKREMSKMQMKYISLQQELDEMKVKMENYDRERCTMPVVASLPPPPPPPPPPLPPSLLLNGTGGALNIVRKKNNKKNGDENKRPVISLEEILNVKLKKTSERPQHARRSTLPSVQQNMLEGVKLRSTASRPSSRSNSLPLQDSVESLLSTDNDSLIRILTNVDSNVRRVKRLRRLDGYSFDDVSRKYGLIRREREQV